MQVDPPQPWNRKKPRRNNLPIGDDHNRVGRNLLQQLLRLGRTNFFRLMHRNPRSGRDFLHRRKRSLLPAPARPVRLRNHRRHLKITLGKQILQGGNSKQRRAAKNDSHQPLNLECLHCRGAACCALSAAYCNNREVFLELTTHPVSSAS